MDVESSGPSVIINSSWKGGGDIQYNAGEDLI